VKKPTRLQIEAIRNLCQQFGLDKPAETVMATQGKAGKWLRLQREELVKKGKMKWDSRWGDRYPKESSGVKVVSVVTITIYSDGTQDTQVRTVGLK